MAGNNLVFTDSKGVKISFTRQDLVRIGKWLANSLESHFKINKDLEIYKMYTDGWLSFNADPSFRGSISKKVIYELCKDVAQMDFEDLKESVGLSEAKALTIHQSKKYRIDIDKMGNYTLKNLRTGKSAYFQGDDAEEWEDLLDADSNFWRMDAVKQDHVLAQYEEIMEGLTPEYPKKDYKDFTQDDREAMRNYEQGKSHKKQGRKDLVGKNKHYDAGYQKD